MFSRRCSLCNGKLNSKYICKECGLDNTKSDKYYKLNQSSCDHQPLTHVHEEKTRTKKVKQKKSSRQIADDKGKSAKNKLNIIISILVFVIGVIPSLIAIFTGLNVTDTIVEPEYYEENYDPYAYVDNDHPQDGEYVEYSLTSGDYIVGIHIPEGNYEAFVEDDFDTVQIKDNENGIYLYEYKGKSEENYLNDLRLFNGAIVTISTRTKVRLESNNAQMQNMRNSLENPANECYILEESEQNIAGQAFDAGIYNLQAVTDIVYVYMTYEDENGESWECYNGLEIGEDSERGPFYQNVVVPEGALIWCEEGTVELIPSEIIGDMDYSRYYW